jgi:cytochrome P450
MAQHAQSNQPPGPRRIPPLEDLRVLQQSPLAAIAKISRDYGAVVRYPVGPLVVYLANHPDYARHILQDNNRNYSKNTFQYNLLKSVTGEGLLTSDGDTWLRQRRLSQPAFHRERIAALTGLMTATTGEMLERWQVHASHGRPVDMAAEMMRVALAIVGRALFSIDLTSEAGELVEAVLVVLDHIVWRARTFGMVPGVLPTARNRRFRAALQTLDHAVYALIKERRCGAGQEGDLLSMLIAAQDPETGTGMSDRQLRDEVMTLLVAGHETVASALAWTWYLLSQNPQAEAKLQAEADALGQGAPPDPNRLPYTRMAFEEALRLYPPAWIITRRALGDDELGGYAIPAGALVVLSPYTAQRDPAYWPEPERYDPERFSPEASSGRPRFAYFPFGGGPRLCIGNTFALLEAQVVLSQVAGRYRLEMARGHPVEVEPGVTLRPKHGLQMTIKPRH